MTLAGCFIGTKPLICQKIKANLIVTDCWMGGIIAQMVYMSSSGGDTEFLSKDHRGTWNVKKNKKNNDMHGWIIIIKTVKLNIYILKITINSDLLVTLKIKFLNY